MGKSIRDFALGGGEVPRLKKPPDNETAELEELEQEMERVLEGMLETIETGASVRSVTVEVDGARGLESAKVRTMYKRKDRKVHPVDTPLPNGINPGGDFLRRQQLAEGETTAEGERIE